MDPYNNPPSSYMNPPSTYTAGADLGGAKGYPAAPTEDYASYYAQYYSQPPPPHSQPPPPRSGYPNPPESVADRYAGSSGRDYADRRDDYSHDRDARRDTRDYRGSDRDYRRDDRRDDRDYYRRDDRDRDARRWDDRESDRRAGYDGGYRGSGRSYDRPSDSGRGGYEDRGGYGSSSYSSGGYSRGSSDTSAPTGEKKLAHDQVYVSGIGPDTTRESIEKMFHVVNFKISKKTGDKMIVLWKNQETGKNRGDALITYDDQFGDSGEIAIRECNGKELDGHVLKVQLAEKREWTGPPGRGGFRGRGRGDFRGGDRDGGYSDRGSGYSSRGGGYESRGFDRGGERGGRGGITPRPGDWVCPGCQNNNFARRDVCHRCNAPRP